MSLRRALGPGLLVGLLLLGQGCGGTLNTGTAKKPANNKPADDGTCPFDHSLCGVGPFAICVDLHEDPAHCGACDRACSPGIACQAGVCQQTVCTGGTSPFSGDPTTSTPASSGQASTQPTPSQLLADVNGDGRLDLVAWSGAFFIPRGNPDLATFHVSLGLPGGGFAAADAYHASAEVVGIFVTDVNSDGADDLFIFSSENENAVYTPYYVEWWLGHPDGHLTRADATGTSGVMASGVTSALAIGDLSGDGWPDMVLQAPYPDTEIGELEVFLSDPTGALHRSQSYDVGWVMRTFVRDMDGNGSPDLVLLTGNNALEILYNRGDGSFAPAMDCGLLLPILGDSAVLMEDFNHDGRMDLALGISNKRVSVLLGLGGCGFTPIKDYEVPGVSAPMLRAVDLNGDGDLDLISVSAVFTLDPSGFGANPTTDNLFVVLLGRGDGTFQLQDPVISLGPDFSDLAVGEVTGDRRPDVTVSDTDGHTRTWENTCQ